MYPYLPLHNYKRIPKVEERLIHNGEMAKKALEEQRKKAEEKPRTRQKTGSKDDQSVVDRLYKRKKEYEEKLEERKKKKTEAVNIVLLIVLLGEMLICAEGGFGAERSDLSTEERQVSQFIQQS